MARFLTKSLLRQNLLPPPPLATVTLRCRSDQPFKPQIIEIDLGDSSTAAATSSSTSASEANYEDARLRRIEDIAHRINMQLSAPDWLPFLPGSSFWVPPHRRLPVKNVLELVGKYANPRTVEERFSVTTVRGWPSSDFFIGDSASTHPVKIEAEVKVPIDEDVEVKVPTNMENISKSDDEEG